MSAEGKEVAPQLLDVDGEVGYALGSIDKDRYAVGVGGGDDMFHGVDSAKDIADVGDADDFRAAADELL